MSGMWMTGMDVARKVVILARECGIQVDLDDVATESLVDPKLQTSPSPEEFLRALPEVTQWLSFTRLASFPC